MSTIRLRVIIAAQQRESARARWVAGAARVAFHYWDALYTRASADEARANRANFNAHAARGLRRIQRVRF